MNKDFKKTLGFLVGCALIFVSPFITYYSISMFYDVPRLKAFGIINVMLQYPVHGLIGLFLFFIGGVLVWKSWGSIKELDAKT